MAGTYIVRRRNSGKVSDRERSEAKEKRETTNSKMSRIRWSITAEERDPSSSLSLSWSSDDPWRTRAR